jgi:hypothetical protein
MNKIVLFVISFFSIGAVCCPVLDGIYSCSDGEQTTIKTVIEKNQIRLEVSSDSFTDSYIADNEWRDLEMDGDLRSARMKVRCSSSAEIGVHFRLDYVGEIFSDEDKYFDFEMISLMYPSEAGISFRQIETKNFVDGTSKTTTEDIHCKKLK